MLIFSVVGLSGSGKTSLISALIKELKKRSFKVVVVKRAQHGFELDQKGTDSWNFSQAGADGIGLVSPEKWALMGKKNNRDFLSIVRSVFKEADFIIVEGGKSLKNISKIEVLRAGVSESIQTQAEDLLAVVSDKPLAQEFMLRLKKPIFQRHETARLAEFLLSQKRGKMSEVKLEVDGKEILLNPFVKSVIRNTMIGMVSALSGVPDRPGSVRLEITEKTGVQEDEK